MPPMKSVSSSALRAVVASSAFVKCYESVKVEREGGNVCMDVRYVHHQYMSINTYRPTPSPGTYSR